MKYTIDPKDKGDISYYENKYDGSGKKGKELYDKIIKWIEKYDDEKNEYIIEYHDTVINFRIKGQAHKAFDITFFNNKDVKICFNVLNYRNNLGDFIDFHIFDGKFDNNNSQIIFKEFDRLLFDLNHKIFTTVIIQKNIGWEDRLKKDMYNLNGEYHGRYVDFLKKENIYKDIQQAVQELEAYIRLHIKSYPVHPEYLYDYVEYHYNNTSIQSVNYNIRKYEPFYKNFYN